MPTNTHRARRAWQPTADFVSHQLLTAESPRPEDQPDSFEGFLEKVLAEDTEIDAYVGYPEIQRDIALERAHDMHHEYLLEELRRQRELGIEAGKVLVLRTSVSLTDDGSSHSLETVDRRRSLGN